MRVSLVVGKVVEMCKSRKRTESKRESRHIEGGERGEGKTETT